MGYRLMPFYSDLVTVVERGNDQERKSDGDDEGETDERIEQREAGA
jgi:hypothetical protein